MTKITKAIIPAAGLGTRFLPQTKAMPKEMLPIIDKPIIQYVVEEAVAAGITDIIIVTGSNKRSIEDHFDHQYELEKKLRESGKDDVATELVQIAEMANFVYLRQKGHAGNGTPILNAAHLLNNEPFLVLWADEFYQSEVPRAVQLMKAWDKLHKPVISLMPVDDEGTKRYGIPAIKADLGGGLFQLGELAEKPGPDKAPSKYASVGGYILTSEVIDLLAEEGPDETGEVYLSRAIDKLAASGEVYGQVIEGRYHDSGNKEKYLEAIVDVALADSELGPGFRDYIASRLR